MQAETLKYLYLFFLHKDYFPLDWVVPRTEIHNFSLPRREVGDRMAAQEGCKVRVTMMRLC